MCCQNKGNRLNHQKQQPSTCCSLFLRATQRFGKTGGFNVFGPVPGGIRRSEGRRQWGGRGIRANHGGLYEIAPPRVMIMHQATSVITRHVYAIIDNGAVCTEGAVVRCCGNFYGVNQCEVCSFAHHPFCRHSWPAAVAITFGGFQIYLRGPGHTSGVLLARRGVVDGLPGLAGGPSIFEAACSRTVTISALHSVIESSHRIMSWWTQSIVGTAILGLLWISSA